MGFACKFCNKKYTRNYNLTRHIEENHQKNYALPKFICDSCGYSCLRKDNLRKHIESVHLYFHQKKKRRIICYECNSPVSTLDAYHGHLTGVHNKVLDRRRITFSNLPDFLQWKKTTENATVSKFVKRSKTKKRSDGTEMIYYYCHRAFHVRMITNPKKRKHAGSNKTGYACSAYMKVLAKETEILVDFCSTHCGHDNEVGRLTLNKEERVMLAEKLKMGIPPSKIIHDARSQIDETKNEVGRIHLLKSSDLRNIRRSFNIRRDLRYDEDDRVSVETWIKNLKQKKEDSEVIFYKGQNVEYENFKKSDLILVIMSKFQKEMLQTLGHKAICVDRTHDTNEYDFQLFTILVLDEFDEGIPVAFCFSNRSAKEIYKLFFKQVKNKVKQPIRTDSFMSDGELSFYTAWHEVMGPARQQFICRWHLNNTWNINLSKVKNSTKRASVSKTLQSIASEVNVESFHLQLPRFLLQLESDPDTTEFYRYFAENYSENVELWAQCYRMAFPDDTNMRLESVHKTLKYHVVDGKQCIRLDNTIYHLLRLLETKQSERITKFKKQKPTKKTKIIKERHQQSKDYLNLVQRRENGGWIVRSHTHTNKWYEVSYILNEPCCQHICNECRICIHMLKCTCEDHTINKNLCKHIHASIQQSIIANQENPCSRNAKANQSENVDNDYLDVAENLIVVENEEGTDDFLNVEQDQLELTNNWEDQDENATSIEDLHNELISKCTLLMEYASIKRLNVEQCRTALKMLDKIVAMFQEENEVMKTNEIKMMIIYGNLLQND